MCSPKVREREVRGDELGIKEPSAAKVGIEVDINGGDLMI